MWEHIPRPPMSQTQAFPPRGVLIATPLAAYPTRTPTSTASATQGWQQLRQVRHHKTTEVYTRKGNKITANRMMSATPAWTDLLSWTCGRTSLFPCAQLIGVGARAMLAQVLAD